MWCFPLCLSPWWTNQVAGQDKNIGDCAFLLGIRMAPSKTTLNVMDSDLPKLLCSIKAS